MAMGLLDALGCTLSTTNGNGLGDLHEAVNEPLRALPHPRARRVVREGDRVVLRAPAIDDDGAHELSGATPRHAAEVIDAHQVRGAFEDDFRSD